MPAAEEACPSTVLEAAQKHVAKHWPELAEAQPKIARRARRAAAGAKGTLPPGASGPSEYVVTFSGTVKTADGLALPRTARITLDEQGQVLKATSSK